MSYYSSHFDPDLNDEPHVYSGPDQLDRATFEGYSAQVVGGTQLYSDVTLRYTPTDLRPKSFNDGRADILRAAPATYLRFAPCQSYLWFKRRRRHVEVVPNG